MARGVVRLLFSLIGEDKLSSHIAKSQRAMEDMAGSAEKQGKRSANAFGSITGVIDGIPGRLSDVKAGFDLLGDAIAAVEAGIEELAEAERRLNVEKFFAASQGGAEKAKEAVEELNEATGDTVNRGELLQFVNSMTVAGQEMDTVYGLLESSAKVSIATGQPLLEVADQLKDSLITGSMTGFELLGITLDVNKGLEKQAESMGISIDEMSTSEKATKRLAIIQKELSEQLIKLGFDNDSYGRTFQKLQTRIDDTKDAAAEFVAQQFSTSKREEEIAAIKDAVAGVSKELITLLNQSRFDEFTNRLAIATGISTKTIEGANDQILAMGLANTVKLGKLVERLVDDEAAGRQAILEAQRLALLEQDRLEEEANIKRARNMRKLKETIVNIELEISQARAEGNEEVAKGFTDALEVAELELKLLDPQIKEAEARVLRTKLANKQAAEDLKDVKAAFAEVNAQNKDNDKQDKARSKARAQRRTAAKIQEAQELREIQSLRDQTQIDRLKKEKLFGVALQVEIARANRERGKSEAEIKKLNDNELVILQLEHEQEILDLKETYAKLSADADREQQRLDKETKDKQQQDELDRLRKQKEARDAALEDEIRRRERMASFTSALSADLRAYDEETAIVAQGFADVQGAIAQNANNSTRAAASAIQAGGRTTQALIKDTKAAAGVRAAFETAAGFASLAGGDFVGSGLHFTAAALFAGLSGSGAKGKAGQRAVNTQTLRGGGGGAAPGFGQSGQAGNVTVNVAGFVTGTTKELGVSVAESINDVNQTGLTTATV